MTDILNTTGYTWNGSGWSAPSAAAPSGTSVGTAIVNPAFSSTGTSAPYVAPQVAQPSTAELISMGKQGITWDGKKWIYPNSTVPANGLSTAGAASGGTPVAEGFDMYYKMLDATLRAEQLRQSGIDQVVNIAQLATELERSSPTRSADLATKLGIGTLQPDFSWTDRFLNPNTTGMFGGKVGGQDVKLPFAFNGKEMTFFNNNPSVARIISDIGDKFGKPDILTGSQNLIPAAANLFKL